MHPLDYDGCECFDIMEHKTILFNEGTLPICPIVTRILDCPMCLGEGFIEDVFYPSPCCGEKVIGTFGTAYCSSCKKDIHE